MIESTKGCGMCTTVTSMSFNSTEPLVTVVPCENCKRIIEEQNYAEKTVDKKPVEYISVAWADSNTDISW